MPIGRRIVHKGRHVTTEFELNREGIARCARGPLLAAACYDVVANRAKPYAVSISPRSHGDHDDEHVHYQDSFQIRTGEAPIGNEYPMVRAIAQLVNVSPHAAAVEYGTKTHGRGHHVLGLTLLHLSRGGH